MSSTKWIYWRIAMWSNGWPTQDELDSIGQIFEDEGDYDDE